MRAILKSLSSPDVELETYSSREGAGFSFCVEAIIGKCDSDGGDLFYFTVCDLVWLSKEILDKEIIFGKHLIIMEFFNFELLKRAIAAKCEEAKGENWEQISARLSRFGQSEFEDYYIVR